MGDPLLWILVSSTGCQEGIDLLSLLPGVLYHEVCRIPPCVVIEHQHELLRRLLEQSKYVVPNGGFSVY